MLEALTRGLRDAPGFVRAAWLGGSDATGRTDIWSDLDLVLASQPDHIADSIEFVESLVRRSDFDFELRYEVPKPTWHGHDQVFYRLAEAEPPLLLDLVVMSTDAENRFLEPERHGRPVVLLDRDAFVRPAPLDREDIDRRRRERVEAIRVRFPMFQPLVERSIERGRLVEAAYFYESLTLRPLVDLLRAIHCPDRFDFGMRYLERDLPREVYEQIERLCFYSSGAELAERRRDADRMFARALAVWSRD